MYAKWIGKDQYVGPKHRRVLAIRHGDIRKIHAKKDNQYIIEATPGSGSQYHGWVDGENLEIIGDVEEAITIRNDAYRKTKY
jgi:hypothetical protein